MQLFKDALAAALAVVVCLLVIELGLHVAQSDFNPSLMTQDSERFIHLRPGAHGWWRGEGRSYVVINRYGFHDRDDLTIARPANTLRIAVLGSSVVEAVHVPMNESITSIIQNKLQECPQRKWDKVEVLNFGTEGYGLAQQLMTLDKDVWRFDPQIIVDLAALNNDVMNDDRRTKHNGGAFPYFLLENGELVPDTITSQRRPIDSKRLELANKLKELMNHSQILLLLERFQFQLSGWRHPITDQTQEYFVPTTAGAINAWEVSEAVWLKMNSETMSRGDEFWLVTADMNDQVDPDPAHREAFRKALGVPDLYYPDHRVADFAERNHIRHLTLAPLLADYTERNHVYLHGFYNTPPNYGHWNILGNRVAGDLVADRLCRESTLLRRFNPSENEQSSLSPSEVVR
ncbi:hypothetical protein HNQ77_001025 [Silvibacterium bohemicum]|uniref:Uncharacterized protein n=1 Tax=Silvibacterium bohemicum TaxID=1577686 RepID=A0A841JVR7_9BACT|nr:hypothetical protein [Silvibacterium bohemicum]MBB6143081.1 hypothetical protein [Silvibacterium bohemicum]